MHHVYSKYITKFTRNACFSSFNISSNTSSWPFRFRLFKNTNYFLFLFCRFVVKQFMSLLMNQSNRQSVTKLIFNFFYNIVANRLCLYINLACLGVCLFVSNKRQNGWTGEAQIFCGISRDPREGLWIVKFSKICLHQNSIFENFENPRNFFWKSAKFFVFIIC